jgi:hypothetical protein
MRIIYEVFLTCPEPPLILVFSFCCMVIKGRIEENLIEIGFKVVVEYRDVRQCNGTKIE